MARIISFEYKIYFLAFLSGIVMLAFELLSTKMLTPVYGSSLVVWSVILAMTLFALASGQFIGGYISDRMPSFTNFFILLFFNAVLISFCPLLLKLLLPQFIGFDFLTSLFASGFILIFFPMIFLGINSPFLAKLLIANISISGKKAGTIYAISTLGGITGVFICAFFLIPDIGVLNSIPFLSILLLIPIIYYFISIRQYVILIGVVLFSFLAAIYFKPENTSSSEAKVIHESDGILGQIKVLDIPLYTENNVIDRRVLLLNYIGQTMIDKKDGSSRFAYPHYISTFASSYAENSDILLLGLGGGVLAKEFNDLGHNLDIVELDERMVDITKTFFYPDLKGNITISDARYFLRINKKKYDIIVIDVYGGEVPPFQMLTKEAFLSIKNQLNHNGAIIINFNGYWDGDKGRATRSVAHTLNESGFNIMITPTPGTEINRNILIIGKLNDFKGTHSISPRNSCCIHWGVPHMSNWSRIKLDQPAEIITDNYPNIELFNTSVAYEWRKSSIELYQKKLLNGKISLF